MKNVIDISTGTPTKISVQSDYIECSICGLYKHPDHYKLPDQDFQSRTNCTSCYNRDISHWGLLKGGVDAIKNSDDYKRLKSQMMHDGAYMYNSISVSDMIELLLKLPKDSRLIVTQEGYYADGEFAEIHDPMEKIEIDGIKFYSIGNSAQNY